MGSIFPLDETNFVSDFEAALPTTRLHTNRASACVL